ncbi:MAG: hypothetical protein M1820_002240 [Bogoriella megaspora]|nr:MAG: hypothetical protein M1820_002240 [Bogoriella megaspora]
MSQNGLLVVIGATGAQGQSVINHVSKQFPEMKIRGISRNSSSPASQALKNKGVEMVTGDMTNRESLVVAFKGATTIFAMTDFWAPVFARIGAGKIENIWPDSIDLEVNTGKNIADAAYATLPTLERFIFSSLQPEMGHSPWAAGKLQIIEYIESLPKGLKNLVDITQLVWPAYFMENFKNYEGFIKPKKDENGNWISSTPMRADKPINLLAARRDTGLYVAAILARPPPSAENKTKPVFMYSEVRTYSQAFEVIGKENGHELRYKQKPAGQAAKEAPGIGEAFQEMYDHLGSDEPRNGPDVCIGPKELGIDLSKATSFEEHVRANNWDNWFVE